MRGGFGCLLIIVAVAVLLGIMVIPVLPDFDDEPVVDEYMQALLCPENMTIDRDLYETRDEDGVSYSMDVYCESRTAKSIDVTEKWMLYGIVGFAAPFLIGLFVLIFGVANRVRNAAQVAVNRNAIGGASRMPDLTSLSIAPTPNATVGTVVVGTPPSNAWTQQQPYQPSAPVARYVPTSHPKDDFEVTMHPKDEYDGQPPALVARLKELKGARDSGLITNSEHDKLRQEVLDMWKNK